MPLERKYVPMSGFKAADIEAAGMEASKAKVERGNLYSVCYKKNVKIGGYQWDVHVTFAKTDILKKKDGKEIGYTIDAFHVSAKSDDFVARGDWRFNQGWKAVGWDTKASPKTMDFPYARDEDELKKLRDSLMAAINARAEQVEVGFGGGSVPNIS